MKYQETANRLREALNDKGISQQELAIRSGVGKSSISHYYNGNNRPHNIAAGKMAKVLGVSPQWLMGLSDVKYDRSVDLVFLPNKSIIEDSAYLSIMKHASKLSPEYMERLEAYARELSELQKLKEKGGHSDVDRKD